MPSLPPQLRGYGVPSSAFATLPPPSASVSVYFSPPSTQDEDTHLDLQFKSVHVGLVVVALGRDSLHLRFEADEPQLP